MGNLPWTYRPNALAILHANKADIWVVQQNTNGPFAESSRIPEDIKYRIRAVPGVAEASPLSSRPSRSSVTANPSVFS